MPDFNLTTHAGCLINDWYNDRILIQDGQKARIVGVEVFNIDTFERVMPRCRQSDSAKTWKSVQQASLEVVNAPATRPAPAPRNELIKAAIQRECEEQVNSIKPAVFPPLRTTETKERYSTVDYPRALYVEGAKSKRKNQKLPGQKEPHEEYGVEADTELYRRTDYATCPPMTLFSARAPEGVFAGKLGEVTALAASAALEASSVLPRTFHAGSGPYIPAPGSELSLKLLFTKLARRLKDVGMTPHTFIDSLRPLVAPAEDEYGVKSAEGPADGVPAASFRRIVYAAKILMGDAALGSVIIACDSGRDGRVSLAALEHFLSDVGIVA